MKIRPSLVFVVLFAMIPASHAQQRGATADPELTAQRNALEKELESVAIIERKVMVPMRDGKHMTKWGQPESLSEIEFLRRRINHLRRLHSS